MGTFNYGWELSDRMNRIRLVFEKDFNERLYWKRRQYVQSHTKGILYYIRMILLRRTEARKLCSTGLGLPGNCCQINGKLKLYHGLNGITIARNVIIGKNVTIFQHVTIAEPDKNKKTIIADDVMIGAGAVIMNNVSIGRGARIGANAVVL